MKGKQKKRYHFSVIYRNFHPSALSDLLNMFECYGHGEFAIDLAKKFVDKLVRGYGINHLNDIINFNEGYAITATRMTGGTILDVVREFRSRFGSQDGLLNQLIEYIIQSGGQGLRDKTRYLTTNESDFIAAVFCSSVIPVGQTIA